MVGITRPEKKRRNLLFSFLCLIGCLLNLDKLLLTIVRDADLALRISRTDHIFLVFVIPLYLHFTISILQHRGLRLLLKAFYLLSLFLVPLTQLDPYLSGVRLHRFGFFAEAGPLFDLFLYLSAVSIGLSFALLIRGLREQKISVERLRIKYVLLSFGLAAILNHFDVLVMRGYDLYPLGNFVFLPMSLMAYALYRYDLMDWRVFLSRGLNFAILLFLALSVFASSYTILKHLFPTLRCEITAFVALCPSLICFYCALSWVERFILHFLEQKHEHRIKSIRDLSLEVLKLQDVEEIKKTVEKSIEEILDVEKCEIKERVDGKEKEGVLRPDDPFFSLGFRLLLPISSQRLPSLLLVGEKKEMKVFSEAELSVLSLLANHLALSFDNALNFRELKDLTSSLEKAVEQRTKALVRSESLAGLGRLAAGVAHELNNPLASVMSTLEYLRDHVRENDPLHDDLSFCLKELRRARDMVASLLGIARQKGDLREPIDVHRPIEDALRVLEPEIKKKRLRIEKEFEAQDALVLGDPSRLAQVFINILKNAIDAQEEGVIRVRTTSLGGALQVKIADEGEGIEEDHLGEIFKPFFTTKKGKGLGLGLFIVRQIVEDHKGSIEVKSKKGEGTEFTVTFPTHQG